MMWSDRDIERALEILGRYRPDRYREAVQEIGQAIGRPIEPSHLKNAFLRRKMASPTTFLRAETPRVDAVKSAHHENTKRALSDLAERILRLTKGQRTASLEEVANAIDMSPARTHRAVEELQAAGYAFNLESGRLGFKLPESGTEIQNVAVAPVKGGRRKVAVISDTHLGSKYCLRAQLIEFIQYAYQQGVREILHPGDVLDGCYRHGVFELSHSGIEEQTRDLFETLPQLPGLTYHCIAGNHDDTFSDLIGIDAGGYIQNYFEANGRHDLKFYGRRGAYLRMHGATIELWHPKKGPGYSLSYGLQNHIRDYGVGAKPDVLLTGHWHVWCYLEQRGVHALACGTFQGGGSAYGKSLGGAPSMGGTILSWELTEDGTLRRFQVERSAYYEHERPREVKGAA